MFYIYLILDFTEEDLSKNRGNGDSITFAYRSSKKSVTVKASSTQYHFEVNDISDMTSTLDHFIIRLMDHYKRMGIKDFTFKLKYDKEFVKLVIVKFLKSIETHAKERIKLKTYEVRSRSIKFYNLAFVTSSNRCFD